MHDKYQDWKGDTLYREAVIWWIGNNGKGLIDNPSRNFSNSSPRSEGIVSHSWFILFFASFQNHKILRDVFDMNATKIQFYPIRSKLIRFFWWYSRNVLNFLLIFFIFITVVGVIELLLCRSDPKVLFWCDGTHFCSHFVLIVCLFLFAELFISIHKLKQTWKNPSEIHYKMYVSWDLKSSYIPHTHGHGR